MRKCVKSARPNKSKNNQQQHTTISRFTYGRAVQWAFVVEENEKNTLHTPQKTHKSLKRENKEDDEITKQTKLCKCVK